MSPTAATPSADGVPQKGRNPQGVDAAANGTDRRRFLRMVHPMRNPHGTTTRRVPWPELPKPDGWSYRQRRNRNGRSGRRRRHRLRSPDRTLCRRAGRIREHPVEDRGVRVAPVRLLHARRQDESSKSKAVPEAVERRLRCRGNAHPGDEAELRGEPRNDAESHGTNRSLPRTKPRRGRRVARTPATRNRRRWSCRADRRDARRRMIAA